MRAATLALVLLACSSNKELPALPGGGQPSDTTRVDLPGCPYAVVIPATRAFRDVAPDDGTASTAPLRVHLGVGGGSEAADPSTSIAFTWETASLTHGARARIGTSPAALTDARVGYSWTTADGAFLHEAHACGLAPATTYFYQVGGGDTWSAPQPFTTLPLARDAITIGVSGDSRDSTDVFQLVQSRMRDASVALQLFTGDLVADGTSRGELTAYLDRLWSGAVFLPVAGNHENQSPLFYAAFALPGEGPYAETFGAVDVGSAHVVLLDDEALAVDASLPESQAQLAFLDADLARADASRAARPFVIVVNHRGVLSTAGHGGEADVLAVRKALLPLFDRHHVDLVLEGHDHHFERTKPVRAAANPLDSPTVSAGADRGTVYAIAGGAGAKASSNKGTSTAYLATSALFGDGTPYVGVYSLLRLEMTKLRLETRGLKTGGGGVAGDDVLDVVEIAR